jgi:DNA-binding transcriptional ArsR family regulator
MLKSEEPLSAVFKCLGDPGRRAMLVRLSLGEATLGQLAEPLEMSLPAVHQHLAVLENAGLVTCEKRGRERWSRLVPAELTHAQEWLSDRCRLWEQRLSGLDEYLAAEATDQRRSATEASDQSGRTRRTSGR